MQIIWQSIKKWRFDVQTIGGNIEDEEGDESTRVRDDGEELRLHLKTISECFSRNRKESLPGE